MNAPTATLFIERKPRTERHVWMRESLSRRVNDGVAAQLLQIWLVSAQSALLCDFLDGLGVPHEKNGTNDDLPPQPPREKLVEARSTASWR